MLPGQVGLVHLSAGFHRRGTMLLYKMSIYEIGNEIQVVFLGK